MSGRERGSHALEDDQGVKVVPHANKVSRKTEELKLECDYFCLSYFYQTHKFRRSGDGLHAVGGLQRGFVQNAFCHRGLLQKEGAGIFLPVHRGKE